MEQPDPINPEPDGGAEPAWWIEWAGKAHAWRLGPRALWRLQGPDAVRYANGQVTRNVERLAPGQAALSCVTNAKGQFQFLVTLMREGADAVLIDVDPARAEELEARLGRYLIADDAELAEAAGWSGNVLHHVVMPSGDASQLRLPGSVVRLESDRMGAPGLDLWVTPEQESELLSALDEAGIEPHQVGGESVEDGTGGGVPVAAAEFSRILLGMPAPGSELDEKTLPPEAGLDRWAIDYHKGCYIGQEVLSRLFSVGRVNRLLVRFWADADAARGIRVGDPLVDPAAPELVVGKITSVAIRPQLDRLAALAYVKRSGPGCTRLMTATEAREPGIILNRIPDHLQFA